MRMTSFEDWIIFLGNIETRRTSLASKGKLGAQYQQYYAENFLPSTVRFSLRDVNHYSHVTIMLFRPKQSSVYM